MSVLVEVLACAPLRHILGQPCFTTDKAGNKKQLSVSTRSTNIVFRFTDGKIGQPRRYPSGCCTASNLSTVLLSRGLIILQLSVYITEERQNNQFFSWLGFRVNHDLSCNAYHSIAFYGSVCYHLLGHWP